MYWIQENMRTYRVYSALAPYLRDLHHFVRILSGKQWGTDDRLQKRPSAELPLLRDVYARTVNIKNIINL